MKTGNKSSENVTTLNSWDREKKSESHSRVK